MKKVIKILLILIGSFPFIFSIYCMLDRAINGYCFSITGNCTKQYGWAAATDGIELALALLWPIYLIGLILIIIGILLKTKKKEK